MKPSCLFTLSAPSGAGKTSLVKAMLAEHGDSICVSVSHATRAKRSGEVDGKDYHFVDVGTFETMVTNDQFLEYADVFDNRYGTAQSSVDALLQSGKNVILEIDWQGARQVKAKMPETVCIYILPPSREALEQRLISRGTDDKQIIEKRMRAADREMSYYNDAEYIVINEDFNQALNDLTCIIHSQGLKLDRQKLKYRELLDSIPAEID